MRALRHILLAAFAAIVAALAIICPSCTPRGTTADDGTHALPDTLRVATLYSPGSYFIYRDEPMGFDYSLISQFAEDKGLVLRLEVAPSVHRALEMLDSGRVDLIAYEIPEITEYRDNVVPCGPRSETHQVLVQPKMRGEPEITDVTRLPGRKITVEDNTKYLYRLQNLNEELGGGIDIDILHNDTLIIDDLIEMVADNEIPLTVADNDIARINATYYPALDVSLPLSFPQASAWAVSPRNAWLGDSIDAWLDTDRTRQAEAELHKRYFEVSKVSDDGRTYQLRDGALSKYDNLFRRYAPEIDWDWRLLASQSLQESRFNPNAVSWAGARGLMQIMPRTAGGYGVKPGALSNPETSVKLSVKILRDLDRQLHSRVPDDRERIKFILAAYNGGLGHVTDAMALAEKYGYDPAVWDDNVERAILMKSNPQYYNDPVVKYGYMRGRETVGYVKKILNYYDRFKREIPV